MKRLKKVLLALIVVIVSFGCATKATIPDEPTIWVISEIHSGSANLSGGLYGYKAVPINHGNVNAKNVWFLDYSGKFKVGDIVRFELAKTSK